MRYDSRVICANTSRVLPAHQLTMDGGRKRLVASATLSEALILSPVGRSVEVFEPTSVLNLLLLENLYKL